MFGWVLEKRGYTPEVATGLSTFGANALLEMDGISDATFGRYEKGGAGASATNTTAFNGAYDAIKKLTRTDLTFATGLAERHRQNPKAYQQTMDNLSKTMIENPAIAAKVEGIAKSGNGAQMLGLYDDFQKDPGATYNKLAGVTPTPAAGPTTAGTPSQPAGDDTRRDQYDAATAKARFEGMMKDPNNKKLADAIKQSKAEDKILAELQKKPDLVKNFDLPPNRAQYQNTLEKGDMAGFMAKFTGADIQPQTTQAGMAGGIGDVVSGLMDFVKGMLGDSGGPGGRGGHGLMGILAKVGSALGIGVLGPATNVNRMLEKNPIFAKTMDLDGYAADLTRQAQSSNPQLAADAQKQLAKLGIDKKEGQDIARGEAGVYHVGIEQTAIKGKDPKTGQDVITGFKPEAKGVVMRYTDLNGLVDATKPQAGSTPATPAPVNTGPKSTDPAATNELRPPMPAAVTTE